METNHVNKPVLDLVRLTRDLKNEDAQNLRRTNNALWIYWILIPVYTLLFILNLVKGVEASEIIEFLFFVLAFLGFAFLFRKSYMEYKSVDYGLPTVEMLTKAAKRYQPFQGKLFLILIPLVLMGVGLTFRMQGEISNPNFLVRIIIVQAIYYLTIFAAMFIGYLFWRVRQKPLRDTALALLKEFES